MKTIYLVQEGQYSDTRPVGFFENEKDAELFCALMRNRLDDPFIDDIKSLEIETTYSREDVRKVYSFIYTSQDKRAIHLTHYFVLGDHETKIEPSGKDYNVTVTASNHDIGRDKAIKAVAAMLESRGYE